MKPIMPWDSDEPLDPAGIVVWWSRLDQRWQVEVRRADGDAGTYHGILCIFDHTYDDRLVHQQPVGLSYGATFGADMQDVADWQAIACDVVDNLEST